MFLFTRMGWLVPVIWLAALALGSQVPKDVTAQHGMGLSHHAAVFFLAAALSAPLLWLAGALLNREKSARTIRPFGRERVVYWGPHTFYMFPIGYWAIVIPVATVLGYLLLPLIG